MLFDGHNIIEHVVLYGAIIIAIHMSGSLLCILGNVHYAWCSAWWRLFHSAKPELPRGFFFGCMVFQTGHDHNCIPKQLYLVKIGILNIFALQLERTLFLLNATQI